MTPVFKFREFWHASRMKLEKFLSMLEKGKLHCINYCKLGFLIYSGFGSVFFLCSTGLAVLFTKTRGSCKTFHILKGMEKYPFPYSVSYYRRNADPTDLLLSAF